ncbi:MAG TPA: adenylyltransferase/cytidyltransferase family protein [Candidatus Nanoarchaeia archaeon]|nr:adenylyltransferase/cytidyltransferase family protein [Candidatus Nanoarchaeia archaeon]
MTITLSFGTFDIIHPGHIYFLKKAKELGDRLVVVVARDSTIKEVKKNSPKYNENQRLQHIKDLRIADEAMIGNEDDKYRVIEEIKPEIIALGYDQEHFAKDLDKEMKKRGINAKVIRIDAYKKEQYKSSKLR